MCYITQHFRIRENRLKGLLTLAELPYWAVVKASKSITLGKPNYEVGKEPSLGKLQKRRVLIVVNHLYRISTPSGYSVAKTDEINRCVEAIPAIESIGKVSEFGLLSGIGANKGTLFI